MGNWTMGAIALAFFGVSWMVDSMFGTVALVIFGAVMLVGPVLILEGVRQLRHRLGDSPT